MSGLCLGQADLAEFAAATGDRNPLHLDPEFARVSTFGQPIAHGVLAAAATLALTGAELTGVIRLAIDFDLPVLPGVCYRVQPAAEGARLRLGDTTALSIRWATGDPEPAGRSERPPAPAGQSERPPAPAGRSGRPPAPAGRSGRPPAPAGRSGRPPAGSPRVLSFRQLARLGAESGRYQADLAALHALLRRITGASIPDRLAEPLAWASFFAGMRTPGRDALLAGLRLDVLADGADPPDPWCPAVYQARMARFDERTGLVTLRARLHGRSTAGLTVSAFLRHRIEPSGLGDLPRSDRLAGRTVLIIGASRGLGAALAGCLAGQGARVLALSSRPAPPELADRAREARLAIDWVRCEAGDADRLAAVLGDTPLDGLVLAAGPRVVGLPLTPETVPACAAHVDEAIRLAFTPLAVTARQLRDDAFVVFVSSAAVTRSQPLWPHYVMAKAALEGLAGHTAQHHPGWRVVVARPPRLRTEMANGPASALSAIAPSAAAADIVTRFLAGAPTPGQVQLIEGPVLPAATTARAR